MPSNTNNKIKNQTVQLPSNDEIISRSYIIGVRVFWVVFLSLAGFMLRHITDDTDFGAWFYGAVFAVMCTSATVVVIASLLTGRMQAFLRFPGKSKKTSGP